MAKTTTRELCRNESAQIPVATGEGGCAEQSCERVAIDEMLFSRVVSAPGLSALITAQTRQSLDDGSSDFVQRRRPDWKHRRPGLLVDHASEEIDAATGGEAHAALYQLREKRTTFLCAEYPG